MRTWSARSAPTRRLSTQMWRVLEMQRKSRGPGRRIAYMARVRHEDLMALKDLAESGKLSPVIDRRHALSEVPEAIRYVGTGHARGKVVIRVA
jgi:NADPH:quinone reductase-like Zn-dependent oxidoreductase